MKPIRKDDMTKALFFNEIDNTVRTAEEEFITSGEHSHAKRLTKDESIRYYYNSLGFRSDEFTNEHDGEHVLFVGCSETEGVGGPLESCWSYMTYQELAKEKTLSGFFNLARYGWGYDVILSNTMAYIKKYGKPDKIFILFPNIGRFYKWKDADDESSEIFHYIGAIPNAVEDTSNEPYWKRKISVATQRSNFIIFTMLVKMFEEYCASNNIELLWSTWDEDDATNYQNIGIFNEFVKMAKAYDFVKSNQDLFLSQIKVKSDWERKRDGHSGYLFHYVWSKCFLGQIDTKQEK